MTSQLFAKAALAQARAPAWRPLALLLFVLLMGTNALLASHAPPRGGRPDTVFTLAGIVRGIGLISISVALLRIAAGSLRPRWLPDGGFFLYLGISAVALALSAAAAGIAAPWPIWARVVLVECAAILLVAPFARWMVAAAVEKPLALAPAPWFRGLGEWLPPYLLVSLPLVVLACGHAYASLGLLSLVGAPAFWPLALVDGLLSTALVLLTLALRVTAYRGVAPE